MGGWMLTRKDSERLKSDALESLFNRVAKKHLRATTESLKESEPFNNFNSALAPRHHK